MSDDKKTLPPKSLLGRSARLLGVASKIAAKEVSSRIDQRLQSNEAYAKVKQVKTQMEQARSLVHSLRHLRGAAMKVGQMLSVEGVDFLPPEVIEILSELQDKGKSMPEGEVQRILKQNFSEEVLAELQGLSPEPVAAASIGQVHRATFRGEPVALKVQFPGIAKSVKTDVDGLGTILKGMIALSAKRQVNFDGLLEEMKNVLILETDYLQEMKHIQLYQEKTKELPHFAIPRAVPELTAATVLAMSYEQGVRFLDYAKLEASLEEREFFGRKILDLYISELMDWGLVQTDPNFANFFIRPEERQLVLLDFGATKTFSAEFRQRYAQFIKTILDQDRAGAIEIIHELELLDPRESDEVKDAFIAFVRNTLGPLIAERFDFTNPDFSEETRTSVMGFVQKLRFSPPPRTIIFLHRKLGGVFRMIKALKLELDLRPDLERFIAAGEEKLSEPDPNGILL